MSKIFDELDPKTFALGVQQHALVLDFTTAVEEAMLSADVTQSDLAKRLGKSRAWVSKVLRQKPNLTFFTAVEIASALELEVELRVAPARRAPQGVRFANVISFPNAAARPIAASEQPRESATAEMKAVVG